METTIAALSVLALLSVGSPLKAEGSTLTVLIPFAGLQYTSNCQPIFENDGLSKRDFPADEFPQAVLSEKFTPLYLSNQKDGQERRNARIGTRDGRLVSEGDMDIREVIQMMKNDFRATGAGPGTASSMIGLSFCKVSKK